MSKIGKLLGVDTDVDERDVDEVEQDVDEVEQDDDEQDEELRPSGVKALRAERQRVRELERENARLKARKVTPKAEKIDPDEIRASIRAELASEFGMELARESAVSILAEAGYKGKPERGAKLLDLESVLDGGKVNKEALRDAVADWKDEEPQLFRRSRKADEDIEDEEPARRRSTGSADLGRKSAAPSEEEDPLARALGALVGRKRLA